ncbi:hypothetical protein LWI29_007276 [Acer saccharum]|uniref:Uncharacterized protein n=1 Tax=Acer saccharum TaxID=4024 RepID=A0AA39VBA8_ACESA|nr:hypothetical protein LWI29_007276 [Acer saccharum]
MGLEGDSNESRLAGGSEDGGVPINIRCSNGTKFTVTANLELTVEAFKAVLAQNCDIPADQQRLIFKGRILKDDQTLQSYGLQADQNVHMVRGFAVSSSAPNSATANSGSANTTPSVTNGFGSNGGGGLGGTGLGASLFPGLGLNAAGSGGAPGLFGAGFPELDQVQQQRSQNPNMMRDLMNMPAIQNMMNNPELLRGMIMNNPQMREVIDRNPELAHVLNDPGILRQSLEIARNPELMREMMRHTDRAMSNIESSPEGFNMLRPLLGNQGGVQARDASTNNPSATGSEALTAPNSNPLPNPWSNAAGGTQTNTNARPNSAGDARAQGLGGLGELGVPGMEQLLTGGMPDTSQLDQLFQNPALMQLTQSLLSNPQYMNQLHGDGGTGTIDLNSRVRELMQDPELLRQLSSPETMRQLLVMRQSLLSELNQQQSTQEQVQPGTGMGAGPNNTGLDMLMNMFGGLGAGGLAASNQPNVPPEELYATQLSQLQEMGFFDTQENIRALRATSGNVHAAVERLLGNLGQ